MCSVWLSFSVKAASASKCLHTLLHFSTSVYTRVDSQGPMETDHMLLFKFEIVVKSHEALSSVFMVNELFTHSLILLLRLNPSSTRSVSWIQSQQSSGGWGGGEYALHSSPVHHRVKQIFTLTLTPEVNLMCPINLILNPHVFRLSEEKV